jgi:hypothetical protein
MRKFSLKNIKSEKCQFATFYVSLFTFVFIAFFSACKPEKPRVLPFIGERELVNGDSIYTQIPDFRF